MRTFIAIFIILNCIVNISCSSLSERLDHCQLKNLEKIKGMKTFLRALNRMFHDYDLSIIENTKFNLIQKLKNIQHSIKSELYRTRVNQKIVTDSDKCFKNLSKEYYSSSTAQSWNGIFKTSVKHIALIREYEDKLIDLLEELSMFIEKLQTIRRVIKKNMLREKKQKEIMKQMKKSFT